MSIDRSRRCRNYPNCTTQIFLFDTSSIPHLSHNRMRRISTVHLLGLFLALIFAGTTQADEQPIAWKAQWIWQAQDGPSNSWVAFRKEIEIDNEAETVTATIAADSKYWLWINGELVVFDGGSARGPSPYRPWERVPKTWELPPDRKPSNTWCDAIDITTYLRPGKNVIAALVWYWGRETHKGTHIDSGKGGFLFQANLGAKLIISDNSWKVRANTGYDVDSGEPSKNLVQYSVKYDARRSIGEWTSPEFSDEHWDAAIEKGLPPTAPWFNLEQQYVPPLVNHGLQFYVNYPESTFPFVSSGETIRCRLPFNQQITPYLEVESMGGEVIEITTDNRLNAIEAVYQTRQGNQEFESYSWMNGHAVQYRIPKGVKVRSLKYRWMSVGEMAGSFSCSDPFYERLWWMGRNTLFVCSRDNFMDCPDRERACWIGDIADQASYLFYCMDDPGRQLLKKAIRTTMAYSHEGVFASLGPLRLRELPSQSLQFIDQGIWQYYFNTGDRDTLQYAYPYVRTYLELWQMHADGSPQYRRGKMDAWDWSDWGTKDTIDKPIVQAALYYMALNSARKMAATLGLSEDIERYDASIASMSSAFETKGWTGTFYSSDPSQFQDDRANCLMILSGLAAPDRHALIAENVLKENHFCSPHFEWMVEEALCYAGMHEEALKRMKSRYAPQVAQQNMTTLSEMFPRGGSYNHAWNSPNVVLSKHIAGIAPTKPGWSEFQIVPNMAHLTSLEQVVPTVKGPITVSMKKFDDGLHIELQSPPMTTALVGISRSPDKVSQIRVNDAVVWEDGHFVDQSFSTSAPTSEADALKLRFQPGVWSIEKITK